MEDVFMTTQWHPNLRMHILKVLKIRASEELRAGHRIMESQETYHRKYPLTPWEPQEIPSVLLTHSSIPTFILNIFQLFLVLSTVMLTEGAKMSRHIISPWVHRLPVHLVHIPHSSNLVDVNYWSLRMVRLTRAKPDLNPNGNGRAGN